MDELTGKCLKAFEMWLDECPVGPYRTMFNSIPLIVQQAYLLDFFDSVEIPITPYIPNETGYWAHNYENKAKYDSRSEAITKAIPIVNEIYNQKIKLY